jgi:protein SCO1/2
MRALFFITISALVMTSACSRARTYELRGQVLAVDAARSELTIKHEDIRGFMPAMTMPFKVRDATLLAERKPGELVRATLVLEDDGAFLSAIERTGEAPLAEPPPAPRVDPIAPGSEAPDFSFIDTTGAQRKLADWRGRAVAVTFVYTRCPLPDFCPLMDKNFAAIQEAVTRDEQLRDRVRLLSVSFDPEYDTPAVLAGHAARAHANPAVWVFATGARDEVDRFASKFGVSIVRDDPASREIVHNLRTAVIDPAGKVTTILTGNEWKPAELLAALREAAGVR